MRKATKVTFTGALGQQLSGNLRLPDGEPRAFALFAHCFTCGKDLRIASRMARILADHGFGVLRFDFTGLGESEGDFADTSFSSNVDDLLAAADFLRREHEAPQLLIGHSLGGAAVLAAAARIEESAAVATIAAPAEPAHVRKLVVGSEAELARRGDAQVSIGGRPFRIKQAFVDDLGKHCNRERIGALGRALLVMHAPQDLVVGVDNAQDIFMAARHPKSFISLDGADHLLSRPADADYAALTIAAWASRYLKSTPAEPEPVAASDDSVSVSIAERGLAADILAEGHRLRADEPTSVGGTETGPSPYGYLLGALGACTVMTLRLYADRKGWPLTGATTRLTHDRIHAKDCDDCESTDGRVDVIERELSLSGPLSDEQRARLVEIADRCPVHKTLTSEIKVRTRTV